MTRRRDNKQHSSLSNPSENPSAKRDKRSKCKTYQMRKGKSIRGMAHALEEYLMYQESMICQVLRTQEGEYIVQGMDKNEDMKQWVGLGQTIAIHLIPSDQDTVCVRIEGGKWLTKGAVMVAGFLVSKLLMVSSGYGMVRQAILPRKLNREIQCYLDRPDFD